MLYKETEKLEDKLFKNPTAEYRGTPFWAWNGDLKKEYLFDQIDAFKKMGLGGAHMHVRTGLVQKYLGDDHMQCIKDCTDKFKKEKMPVHEPDDSGTHTRACYLLEGGGFTLKSFLPFEYSLI